MAEGKHTPGSWVIRDGSFIDGPGFTCLATVRAAHVAHEPEAIANARLIAAAPDLLAALQELVAVSEPPERDCSCHLNPPCGWCVEYSAIAEAHEDARAAIARATVTP